MEFLLLKEVVKVAIRIRRIVGLILANAFTVARVPLLVYAINLWVNHEESRIIALAIMVAAALTDFFDGVVARALGGTSDFGRQFDPIVDKVFMWIFAIFAVVQVSEGPLPGLGLYTLTIIMLIELVLAITTIISVKINKKAPKVVDAGKIGMFGRMSSVVLLVLAASIPGHDYSGILVLFGVVFGVAGVAFGVIAMKSYVRELLRSPVMVTPPE